MHRHNTLTSSIKYLRATPHQGLITTGVEDIPQTKFRDLDRVGKGNTRALTTDRKHYMTQTTLVNLL